MIFIFNFFGDHWQSCVLGPWPWPRALQVLASRGSVLKSQSLVLASDFFLSPLYYQVSKKIIFCDDLVNLQFFAFLYAHVRTCSLSYTDEE